MIKDSDYYFKKAKREGLQLSILIENPEGSFSAGFKTGTRHWAMGYGVTPAGALKRALDNSIKHRKNQLGNSGNKKRKRVRL